MKTTSSKSQKIDIFPTGWAHGFGPKMDNFSTFFFKAIDARKISFTIFKNEKKAFLGCKNKKLKKSKNWHFPRGVNPWFWSYNDPFSNFFFFGNIGQENVFYDILHQKNACVAYENNKFKKSKNWHFSNGVSPWFRSKNGQFFNFFL